MAPLRCFIAFDTPSAIREEMSRLQVELKKSSADVRWESSDKFHATIKFLGDVNEEVLPGILKRIEAVAAGSQAFEVVYGTLGCFPNRREPRVIWMGCANADGRLEALKHLLDVELLPFGFEIERRTFHPHVTLGRVKSPRGLKNLTPMLENLTFHPRNALIGEVLLMKSVLRPEGSQYSVIQSLTLKSTH